MRIFVLQNNVDNLYMSCIYTSVPIGIRVCLEGTVYILRSIVNYYYLIRFNKMRL